MKIRFILLLALLLTVAGFSQAAVPNCPSPSNGGPIPNYASYYTIADGFAGIITNSVRINNQIILLVDSDAIFTVGERVVIQGTVNGNGVLNTTGYVQASSPGLVYIAAPGANVPLQADDGKVYPYNPLKLSHPITIDVTVDGETTGNTSCMGGATHPHVMETNVGPTGALIHQSLPVPLTYSTFTSTQTFVEPPDVPISFDVNSDVNCVAMGEVFVDILRIQWELAYTREISLGARSNCIYSENTRLTKCDILAAAWCTPDTTPPDGFAQYITEEVMFNGVPITQPTGWDILFPLIRIGGPGHPWFIVYRGIAAEFYTPHPGLAICDHNP